MDNASDFGYRYRYVNDTAPIADSERKLEDKVKNTVIDSYKFELSLNVKKRYAWLQRRREELKIAI